MANVGQRRPLQTPASIIGTSGTITTTETMAATAGPAAGLAPAPQPAASSAPTTTSSYDDGHDGHHTAAATGLETRHRWYIFIFTLPPEYGSFPDPLLYVEWFTYFGTIDKDIGMHIIGHSTRNHHRRAEIIPVSNVLCTCHLIPRFGKVIDPRWHMDNILDEKIKFYVNLYLRHHDFILFHCA